MRAPRALIVVPNHHKPVGVAARQRTADPGLRVFTAAAGLTVT
jgi:hypothetical protein